MKYVYILECIAEPDRHYTGIADDLKARLAKHNAGEVSHTSKFKPWRSLLFRMQIAHLHLRNILNLHQAGHLRKSDSSPSTD